MIWIKTEAGRTEIQSRALVKERPRRNLLLLIDGSKPEAVLLEHLAGISADDFQALRKLDLIAPASGAVTVSRQPRNDAPAAQPTDPVPLQSPAFDPGEFGAALAKLIAANPGLPGPSLKLAVDKASTAEQLRDLAARVIEQIRDRKGEPAAAQARKTLDGA